VPHTEAQQKYAKFNATEISAEVYLEENINNIVEIIKLYVYDAPIKQSIKTYYPEKLNFDIPKKEENIMEWMHLEPSINKKVDACHAAYITNETINIKSASEKKECNITINLLKRENVRLRKIIKNLKFRLCARKVCRKVTNKKSKERIIQNLIEDQNLHPVAKAMINLQLHTPKAPYTQEEKNLLQQFIIQLLRYVAYDRQVAYFLVNELLEDGMKNII